MTKYIYSMFICSLILLQVVFPAAVLHAEDTIHVGGNDLSVLFRFSGEKVNDLVQGFEEFQGNDGNAYVYAPKGLKDLNIDTRAGINLLYIDTSDELGQNMKRGIVNIFGGSTETSFSNGPDLWIGGRAKLSDTIEYILTVTNYGDTPATNVVVRNEYDVPVGDIGQLAAGASKEISYTPKLDPVTLNSEIFEKFSVTLKESDANMTDNSDVFKFHISSQIKDIINTTAGTINDLQVTRSNDTTGLTQKITVYNPTGTEVKEVQIKDILHDMQGKVIKTETFVLGNVMPFEEVNLTYTIPTSLQDPKNIYSFSSLIEGRRAIDILIPFNGKLSVVPSSITSGTPMAAHVEQLTDQANIVGPLVVAEEVKERSLSTDVSAVVTKLFDPFILIVLGLIILYWVFHRLESRRIVTSGEITEFNLTSNIL